MKTLTISVLSLFLTLSSCNVKSDNGFPFIGTAKQGNGMVKNKVYTLSFDEIKVAQSIHVEIVKSEQEKVVVTAPSDILDDVIVESKNGKLSIHFKPGLNISARNVAVKIFAKDFTAVKATSSASINILDTFTQDQTKIEVSSSASIKGNIEANDLEIEVSSSGTYSGKIWAVNLEADVSSSGDLIISGKTKNAKLEASSSGTLNAKEVLAEYAEVDASSSGSVSLSVANELRATANSSGDVSIRKKGNLNIVSQKESSGGSISIQ
jgi:hypothetical protein